MIDPNRLNQILAGSTVADLARIVWQAGQYNTAIGKVGQLHAAFLIFQDEQTLTEVVCNAATIDEFVSHDEAPAYCQIGDEIIFVLKRLADAGNPQLANRLAMAALEKAEKSSEDIQSANRCRSGCLFSGLTIGTLGFAATTRRE